MSCWNLSSNSVAEVEAEPKLALLAHVHRKGWTVPDFHRCFQPDTMGDIEEIHHRATVDRECMPVLTMMNVHKVGIIGNK